MGAPENRASLTAPWWPCLSGELLPLHLGTALKFFDQMLGRHERDLFPAFRKLQLSPRGRDLGLNHIDALQVHAVGRGEIARALTIEHTPFGNLDRLPPKSSFAFNESERRRVEAHRNNLCTPSMTARKSR